MATVQVSMPSAPAPGSIPPDKHPSDSSDLDSMAVGKRNGSNTSMATANERSKSGLDSTQEDKLGVDTLDPLDRSTLTNRFKTFVTSFKYLRDLTPQQVQEFMDSYVIYSLDWANEEEMRAALGDNYQERVGDCLRSYYGVLNHLCALGDVEKMYIPPVMNKKASVLENQLLFERAMTRALGVKKGDRLLDLGCGRGRVAAHVATITGAKVTGINIDSNQLENAERLSQERGLENDFVLRDMNAGPLPFPDETFDGFYQIQALSLCKDLTVLFKEVFRVLKPGSKLSSCDWVKFPTYDESNPEHATLMKRVKPLIGAVGTPTPALLEKSLADAGFKVLRSENANIASDGLQAPLIKRTDIYFRAVRRAILALVKIRALPAHFKTLINRLCLDGEAFVKMDMMRLITTTYWIVAEKPVAPVETNDNAHEEGAQGAANSDRTLVSQE